ncbi:MAG: DNA polymerase III subunit alpha, partial [Ilumatobacteraceae bacterium]
CTVFPRTLAEQGHKLLEDAIVVLRGRIDKRDEVRIGFMIQEIQVLEAADIASAAALHLRMPSTMLNELRVHQLRKVLREHPGNSPVFLHIGNGKMVRLADEFGVDLDHVVGDLRIAFGHDAVML